MKECRTLVLGNQSSGTASAPVPPDRASGPSRACLQSISRRNPLLVIPKGGQIIQLKLSPERMEGLVDPVQAGDPRAVRFRDKKEELFRRKSSSAKRGVIRAFSRKSRQGLMVLMAGIDFERAGLPVFLTLTYPNEWVQDPREWKRHLDNFLRALRRKWPEVWGVWKLEFQKRGAPHFHALLWDGPVVTGIEARRCNGKFCMVPDLSNEANRAVFTWMSDTWYRVVGSGDQKHLEAGTRIEPVMSRQGVMAYTGKYLGKTEDQELPEGMGRVWGIIGKERWKTSPEKASLDTQEYFTIRRVMRRFYEHKTGKKYRYKSLIRSMNVFMSSATAERIKSWALEARQGCPF